MERYEGERYFATKDDVSDVIAKYGIAIIPSILDNNEIKEMIDGMWDYLETVTSKFDTPISRSNSATWREFRHLLPLHSMMLQWWKVGHAQFIWNLRQNRKIAEIFCRIYEDHSGEDLTPEDLLVSFDGASFHLPPEKSNGLGWETFRGCLHCDQTFTKNDFRCVQSWITGPEVRKGDATITFFEKSHLLHKELAERFEITCTKDWYKLEKENDFLVEKCGEPKFIMCPPGSLVLWDSRLAHCGSRAIKDRQSENIRCIAYISYKERSKITSANLKKKQKAFNEMRMTTHDACKVKLFPVHPRLYDNPLPDIADIPKPILSSLGKKLAGF